MKTYLLLKTHDFEIAENLNKYFQNIVPKLDLKLPNNLLCQAPENGDEVLATISKYQYLNIKTILKNAILAFLSK